MPSLLDSLRIGLTAFKEAFLTSPVKNTDDWNLQDARIMRYNILWAMYEQTSYRDVHKWATAYRKDYSLYKYIRPIYNPAYRLGQFWQSHLFGGLLDPEAGEEGAIPVFTDNEALRPAIAELWKWSRWSVQKDILTTKGTIFGDVAIQVIDDVVRERVYLDIMHPGLLESVEKDPFGNVKGYAVKEMRPDPTGGTGTVTYVMRVTREGDNVLYETFLNGKPYAWEENVDRTGTAVAWWTEPYGFIPLVVLQHNDVGLDWGWSELHPIRAKAQESDDVASMISDSIRKLVDPPFLLSGTKAPKSGVITLTGATDTADTDRPAPGREEISTVYVGDHGAAVALTADRDLENVLLHLQGLIEEMERDVPELSQDINTASGDASGRALRTARQPIVSKVIQRRANYDSAMVAAHQMAVAIGGFRGYEGYKGFGLESYLQGKLDHHITERSVFEEDPLDKIEVDNAFWEAAKKATDAGMPLIAFLLEAGWTEERIKELKIVEPEPEAEGFAQPIGGAPAATPTSGAAPSASVAVAPVVVTVPAPDITVITEEAPGPEVTVQVQEAEDKEVATETVVYRDDQGLITRLVKTPIEDE